MSALNLSWLEDATDQETMSEECWPPEPSGFVWPPLEDDPFADAAPPRPRLKKKRRLWIVKTSGKGRRS